MTKKNSKKIKDWVWMLVFLVILVAAGMVTYVIWNTVKSNEETLHEGVEVIEEVKDDEVTDETGKPGADEGEEKTEETGDDETNAGKKVTQYEGADPNKAEELTGVVTYAGLAGDTVMIRTNIDQFLGEGTCDLEVQQGGATVYSATSNIVAGASTSSCEGFDVNRAEIPGAGNYQIVINLSSGGKTGTLKSEVNL